MSRNVSLEKDEDERLRLALDAWKPIEVAPKAESHRPHTVAAMGHLSAAVMHLAVNAATESPWLPSFAHADAAIAKALDDLGRAKEALGLLKLKGESK